MYSRIAAFTALALLVVSAAACGGTAENTAPPASGGRAAAPDVPPAANSSAATAAERKVTVTSSISLTVPDLRLAFLVTERLARAAGGFTGDASISQQDRNASLRLRVPAVRHDDVMASLRGMSGASVRREDTRATEVSQEYTDLQSRLANLQRTEAQFQTILVQAKTVDEILNLNDRLRNVRGEIDQTEGRIRLLNDLTDFATIKVDLALAAPAKDSGLRSPVEVFALSFAAATTVALLLLNLGAAVLAFALWLLPLSVAAWLLWRAGRRIGPVVKARLR